MFTYSWTRLSSLTSGTQEPLWPLYVKNICNEWMKYFYVWCDSVEYRYTIPQWTFINNDGNIIFYCKDALTGAPEGPGGPRGPIGPCNNKQGHNHLSL